MTTVLLFNFTDKSRLDKILRAALLLKIRIKKVSREDYLQPMGYLAGKKDIAPVEEKYDGSQLEDEMLLMADMTNSQIDGLLQTFRKVGISIKLKAVLTENNQHWNALELFKELKSENEALGKSDKNFIHED
jgi:hypothetical protein